MNLNEIFSVSPAKVELLKAQIKRLGISLQHVEEQFTRGSGKGGQKINKTSNVVILHYAPLGLVVRVGRERHRNINRFLALRELVAQIEMSASPHASGRFKEREKLRKQKDRRARRAKSKMQEAL